MVKRFFIGILVSFLINLPILAQTGIKQRNILSKDAGRAVNELQESVKHKLQIKWDKDYQTPVYLGCRLTDAGYASAADEITSGIKFISENKDIFGLKNPSEELQCISSHKDSLSIRHVKYQQVYNGIRVLKGQMIIHFNTDGSVESINGRYNPTPDISTIPGLSMEDAIQNVRNLKKISKTQKESAELVIYEKYDKLILCYEVKLSFGSTPNYKAYVNANTGEILKIDNGIRYDGPSVGSGISSDGQRRTLNTYILENTCHLIDASLPMYKAPIASHIGVVITYDAKNDTNGSGYNSAAIVTDPNNDNNFNDNERLRAAVDAHFAANAIYKFYKKYFNRNSFSNKGSAIQNVVHYLNKYNNAFWNGATFNFGDGDGARYKNFTRSIDVITHEFTHAVTEYSAGLVYEYQSGALNESMSDVFGCMVDSTDWQIGEDIAISGEGLRDLSNPHKGRATGDIANGWAPENMSEYVELPNTKEGDNGGVHINCSIPSKAFYNVATTIGRWKAGQIWYRSLTEYLTSYSEFEDLRTACKSSAKDIFGQGSPEYKAVEDGFTAVGITEAVIDSSVLALAYDDGTPAMGVYESDANWALGVKFTTPQNYSILSNVLMFSCGENNAAGNGQFTLQLFSEDKNTGLPGTALSTAYLGAFNSTGWLKSPDLNVPLNGNFFVTMKYDGTNQPLIGADTPPGNGRAYEYNPASGIWNKMKSPYDYTIFIRAVLKTTNSIIEIDIKVPEKFSLEQNYPNPFNPCTSIRYSLPEGENVKLEVYDISGRRIAELVSGFQNAGTYTVSWNGRDNMNIQAASGIYFYTIRAGSYIKSQKMILMK